MRSAAILITVLFLGLTIGCNTFQPNAFPRELGAVVQQVGTSVTDQTLWENILARMGGQVVNPGVECGAGMQYVAFARLVGASGQISVEAAGKGVGQLSPEARAKILELVGRPDVFERIMTEIERDRAAKREAAATPPAPVTPPIPPAP